MTNTSTAPRWRRLRRLTAASAALAVTTVVSASAAVAQVDGEPTSVGLPGAALATRIINWLMWGALMACLGALLYGAALWRGGAKQGNFARAADGKDYVSGAAIGALLVGLSVTVVNTLFAAGRAG